MAFLDRLYLGSNRIPPQSEGSNPNMDGQPTLFLGENKLFGEARGPKVSGGTITYDGRYVYHTFTSSADLVVDRYADIEAWDSFDCLIVGGGGAGAATGPGDTKGGGGGGGRVVTLANATFRDLTRDSNYTITVGVGGTSSDVSGSLSSAFGHIAPGGGNGQVGDSGAGYPGGSGGGAGRPQGIENPPGGTAISGSSDNPDTGTIDLNLGNNGGYGDNDATPDPDVTFAGGGGGALSSPQPSQADGGQPYSSNYWNVNGTTIYYSRGGATGGSYAGDQQPTGPGAGGDGSFYTRQDGADGIVVIRYLNPTYQP